MELFEKRRLPLVASVEQACATGMTSEGKTPKTPAKGPQASEGDPDKIKKAIVLATYKRRACRLVLSKRWSSEGFAWIKFEDDGSEEEIELSQLKLNRLIEG